MSIVLGNFAPAYAPQLASEFLSYVKDFTSPARGRQPYSLQKMAHKDSKTALKISFLSSFCCNFGGSALLICGCPSLHIYYTIPIRKVKSFGTKIFQKIAQIFARKNALCATAFKIAPPGWPTSAAGAPPYNICHMKGNKS